MDWIIFGDDWGVHPSTTQHLALSLPPEDKVIWVNSIGMRVPSLSVNDIQRAWKKLNMPASGSGEKEGQPLYKGSLKNCTVIQPKVIPVHMNRLALWINRRVLSQMLNKVCRNNDIRDPILLSATPVVAQYLGAIPHSSVAYLRLDLYEQYPGCDPDLVRHTENILYEAADAIFVTAQALTPKGKFESKVSYLPQGVDLNNFSSVSLEPGREKVLGFFGTLSEWLDFKLIRDLALAMPEWRFEFIGKVDFIADKVDQLENVVIKPAVSFSQLPEQMSSWAAAWIPFLVNDLTEAVNPLKAREYLSAGLPVLSTPMPEVARLGEIIKISQSVNEIKDWLNKMLIDDNYELRSRRRKSMDDESWASRSMVMREVLCGQK